MNLNYEYISGALKLKTEPPLWISEVYMIVDSKLFKQTDLVKIKNFDKKQANELIILEWAMYLFKNIRTYANKSIKNKTFIHYSEKENNMPDFKLHSEYYEVTSAIKIFHEKKGDIPGVSFEQKLMADSIKETRLDLNDKDIIIYGNKNGKYTLEVMALHEKKYKEAFNQILKKSRKKYNIESGAKLNILFWFDRNIKWSTFDHRLALLEFIKYNDGKIIEEIFLKINNIYFLGEDRHTFPDELKINWPKYNASGILFNKEHYEYISRTSEIDFSKYFIAYPTQDTYNLLESILYEGTIVE